MKKYKNIKANIVDIADNVEISDDVEIICDRLVVGEGTVITGGTKIMCKNCHIGKNNFINGAWIEAALNAGNTIIHIGNECLILQGARLNCNTKLVIGSDVNIGQNVEIWTHASSMDVFNGYPYVKSPVTIGNHVWITAGTTIMPGTTVGNHIIIGNKSIVNKDLPDGCFAAGAPVKIIKEKCFPKKLDFKNKEEILLDCITEYTKLLDYKPFNAILQQKANSLTIMMWAEDRGITYFDLENRCMHGDINECSEDFRDFLRYRGIKIFTGKLFKSIKPAWYTKATTTKKKRLFK